MRKNSAVMMTRNNLVNIAIEEAAKQKPGLEALKSQVTGQCAVMPPA